MGYKCCVPNCKGNYTTGPRVSVFSFPKDENLRRMWIRAIHRDNFQPSKNSKVCQAHFKEEEIVTVTKAYTDDGKLLEAPLKKVKLREGAVPTILKDCPSYLSVPSTSRESAEERRLRIENKNLQQAIKESLVSKGDYDKNHQFENFDEFLLLIKAVNCDKWLVVVEKERAIFILLDNIPVPTISISAILSKDLKLSLYYQKAELKRFDKQTYPVSVNNIHVIINTLDSFKSQMLNCDSGHITEKLSDSIISLLSQLEEVIECENKEKIQFLKEQLCLLSLKKHRHRYSPEYSIFSSLLFSISPHCYRFLRGSNYLTLPHPNTIKKICSKYDTSPQHEQCDSNFLMYITQKFSLLNKNDYVVTLMLDEIHLKQYLDFSGGTILGAAYNSEEAATSAHVFMIQSLCSPFKEVVHILPVKKITAENLFHYIKKIVIGLQGIGFNVVCVVSDNNAINRKAMTYFSTPPKTSIVYKHPHTDSAPLFFINDTVHLLKCIRNNWINQKDPGQTLKYPTFLNSSPEDPLNSASFSSLKKMHAVEIGNIVKYAHTLTLKSLAPNNFERQNVQNVLNIFNEHVVQGLMALGEKHNLENHKTTAEFIKLILNWWNVVNVKTNFLEIRFRDPLRKPLSPGEENFIFLENFLNWLHTWGSNNAQYSRLTKETHSALSHTTYGLLELTKYCIKELKLKYILPGKIQTDSLEARFGKYRTMAGTQYLVSVRQIFETESKIRIQNLLPLTLESEKFGIVKINEIDEDSDRADISSLNSLPSSGLSYYNLDFTENDFKNVQKYLPVLTYLAGYCVRSVLKKNKCGICQKYLQLDKMLPVELDKHYDLIKNMDRGGLLYPQEDAVNVVIINYIVIQKLINKDNERGFLQLPNQRSVVIDLTFKKVSDDNFFLMDAECDREGHSRENVLKVIIKAATNIFLNNYVRLRNNSQNSIKKRKLATVN